MTNNPNDVDVLIDSIYAAALDPSKWFDVMAQMTALMNGNAGMLAFADLKGSRQTTQESLMYRWYDHNAGAENMSAYLSHADDDLRTAYGLAHTGQVYADFDFISEQEIARHSFYQEFLRQFDMRYTVGVSLPTTPGVAVVANVLRSPKQGHPERHQIELMERLYPHMARAVLIGEKLDQLEHRNTALLEAFDQLSDGLLIVTGEAKVLVANRQADRMLKARDGLFTRNGLLTTTHQRSADRLSVLIASTAGNQLDQRPDFDAMPIPKSSGGRDLQLLAMPATKPMDDQCSHLPQRPAVILLVSDPDRQPAAPEARLQALFGLTGAEAKLSAALVAGLSINDYAAAAGVTENTARWTLKQVQAKTDCRRQSDLVRLLMASTRAR